MKFKVSAEFERQIQNKPFNFIKSRVSIQTQSNVTDDDLDRTLLFLQGKCKSRVETQLGIKNGEK